MELCKPKFTIVTILGVICIMLIVVANLKRLKVKLCTELLFLHPCRILLFLRHLYLNKMVT
jgi:hypothetical protein